MTTTFIFTMIILIPAAVYSLLQLIHFCIPRSQYMSENNNELISLSQTMPAFGVWLFRLVRSMKIRLGDIWHPGLRPIITSNLSDPLLLIQTVLGTNFLYYFLLDAIPFGSLPSSPYSLSIFQSAATKSKSCVRLS